MLHPHCARRGLQICTTSAASRLGDDTVDDWDKYIDLIAEGVYINSGRGCINTSGVWASRHTKEIAAALAERLGPITAKPPEDPTAGLAAFTVPGQAQAIHASIQQKIKESAAEDMTAKFGPRLVEKERCAYLRPWVIHSSAGASSSTVLGFPWRFR